MAKNKSVVLITIKAVLPIGDTVDAGFQSLARVQKAQADNDWTEVLDNCTSVDVTTQISRRRLVEGGEE